MTADIRVLAAGSLDEDLVAGVRRLLPQLSASARFDEALLRQVLSSEAATLFVARDGAEVLGMATLVVVPCLTGLRGHVEDVVVDERARGLGVGRALLLELVARGRAAGLRTLELTSRPSRAAAIRLYESVGFVRRDTNVLRLGLDATYVSDAPRSRGEARSDLQRQMTCVTPRDERRCSLDFRD